MTTETRRIRQQSGCQPMASSGRSGRSGRTGRTGVRRTNRLLGRPVAHAIWILLPLMVYGPICDGQTIWPSPVQRQTDDRLADLLDELIRLGRYSDAEKVCLASSKTLSAQSDDAAKWAIRHSRVLSAAQMGKSGFDKPTILAVERPVTQMLDAYPQHRRRFFLQAQVASVQSDVARHQIIAVAVSPATEDRIDGAMKSLSRASSDLLELVDEIDKERAELGAQRERKEFSLVKDLVRLQQELQVDAVSLSLMQTELFPLGGQDQLAAATRAEAVANEALARLPASSSARREVERLRIEAILRGGQHVRAETELVAFTRSLPKPLPPNIQAMQVRVDVARERMKSADVRLKRYYGTVPTNASKSIEMDLARLDFLIARDARASEVGNWFDAIEKRNGLYARRRAEALSLTKLRSSGVPQAVDPSLIAAQAEDWLRRGDAARAGALFAAAAAAGSDSDRAVRHATQAAAALLKANQVREAVDVLTKVTIAHREAAAAAATHLQAAITYSTSQRPDVAETIEAILQQNLRTWPESKHASAARRWIVKLFNGQGRHIDAAVAATPLSARNVDNRELDEAIKRWEIALQAVEPESMTAAMTRFRDAFKPLLQNEAAATRYRYAGAYLLEREMLGELPPATAQASPAGAACEAMLAFRIAAGANGPFERPPESLATIFVWRLMRDARLFPQMREAVAEMIESWPEGSTSSLGHAQRLIWQGRIAEAEKSLRGLTKASKRIGGTMAEAAALLGSSDDVKAQAAAVRWWDELAAGVPQGGAAWHEAKLASIRLLAKTGRREEAMRRAKYVLLTAPPSRDEVRQQYRELSQP